MARNNRKERERIARRRSRLLGEAYEIRYCTPKVVEYLKSQPHPKIQDPSFTKYSYVKWLLDNGHPDKAFTIIEPLASIYNEPYNESRYLSLKREQEDCGVPRTYR